MGTNVAGSAKAELLANWQILVVAFLLVFFSFGVPNFSLPYMYKPAMDEFGWSNTQVNLLSTAKFLIGAIAALGMGILIDKIGGKVAVLVGALAGGCAMALFLIATNLPIYYLAGAMLGLSASSIVSAMKVVVSRLYEVNPGLALGIVLGATSLGQTLMPFVWTPLLDAGINWRTIAGMLSLGSLLISAPLWMFFMSRVGATQDIINSSTARAAGAPTMWERAKEISHERGFWYIMLGIFLVSGVDQAMTQNTVTYLRNDKGFNLNDIVWYSSFTGILAVVAKPVAGWVYDHYSIAGIRFFYFLLAVSVLLALPVSGGLSLFLFVTVLGIAHGGLIVEAPVLTKHYLGPRNLGMTIGIVSVAVNLGFAAGPPALGAFVDYFGNYQYGFMAYTVVALVGFALMLPIKPRFWTPPSKRKQEPEAAGVGKLQPAAV